MFTSAGEMKNEGEVEMATTVQTDVVTVSPESLVLHQVLSFIQLG